MKKMIALSTAGILAAATAHAGGIAAAPVEPLVMSPVPVVETQRWTGAYGGLSLGYGTADTQGSTLLEDDSDGDGEDDLFDVDVDGDGAIGGAFAGYQRDFGNFVLGGEIDLNAANIDFDDDDFGDDSDINGGASIDALHRLKVRAGYDAGRTLIYGVAGAAYADAEVLGEEFSDTGYVLGAGLDYGVTENVVVGGEVLYNSFDDFDDTGIDIDSTTVQARVAFKF